MSELVPISQERHASRTWRRPANYLFAAGDPVVMLTSQELPRAITQSALAYILHKDVYVPVAVQGLKQGENFFVSASGTWLGDYVPAAYRTYPFQLALSTDGNQVLCIDEAAGRVSEDGAGEPFFQPDGTPAPAVADIIKLLSGIEADRQRTQRSCEALAKHNLLEPWPLRAQRGDELSDPKGLFRTAETRIYELESDALVEVRNSGGLMIAFAQLFSMQQVHKLGKLGPGSSAASQAAAAGPKLIDVNGIISFENL